jgi:hypothetical protein
MTFHVEHIGKGTILITFHVERRVISSFPAANSQADVPAATAIVAISKE